MTLRIMPQRKYGSNWPQIAQKAKRDVSGRCVNCFFTKASSVHHVRYFCLFRGALSPTNKTKQSKEIPGFDVFPVCDRCHGRLHRRDLWHESINPIKNRNKLSTCLLLVLKYNLRRLPLEVILVCAILAFVVMLVT